MLLLPGSELPAEQLVLNFSNVFSGKCCQSKYSHQHFSWRVSCILLYHCPNRFDFLQDQHLWLQPPTLHPHLQATALLHQRAMKTHHKPCSKTAQHLLGQHRLLSQLLLVATSLTVMIAATTLMLMVAVTTLVLQTQVRVQLHWFVQQLP